MSSPRHKRCKSFKIEHKETGSIGAFHANTPRERERGIGEAARSTRTPPPEAVWLPGYWMYSKPLGDGRGDQPQERIAETSDHDTEHGKPDAERDGTVRGANSHR